MQPVVAVVDSSEEIAELVGMALEHAGFCTAVAFTTDFKRGREALDDFLRTHNPAAVVWDIAIPYEENWAFFLEARESDAAAGRRFIVTTTNRRALESLVGPTPAHEIVGKPYDLDALVERVRHALGDDA